jgi:hypothetical protein
MTPGSLSGQAASRTIMDAVELARRLGVRYIWIDALCILQDDDADKQDTAISRWDRCEDSMQTMPVLNPVIRPTTGIST